MPPRAQELEVLDLGRSQIERSRRVIVVTGKVEVREEIADGEQTDPERRPMRSLLTGVARLSSLRRHGQSGVNGGGRKRSTLVCIWCYGGGEFP